MIQKASQVELHYTLRVEGQVVDTTRERGPLQYTHGEGQLLPAVEAQLEGMKAGEHKKFQIAPEEGYGLVNPKAVQVVPKSVFGDQEVPPSGTVIQMERKGTPPLLATVKGSEGDKVILDFNHPLAGKTLDFEVEILTVSP